MTDRLTGRELAVELTTAALDCITGGDPELFETTNARIATQLEEAPVEILSEALAYQGRLIGMLLAAAAEATGADVGSVWSALLLDAARDEES